MDEPVAVKDTKLVDIKRRLKDRIFPDLNPEGDFFLLFCHSGQFVERKLAKRAYLVKLFQSASVGVALSVSLVGESKFRKNPHAKLL